MPTGYTAPVQEGEITTLRDYALRCARAFGATILMRDEPLDVQIPEKFEPSDYYAKNIDTAKLEIQRLESLTLEEAAAEAQKQFDEATEYRAKRITTRRLQRKRYETMLAAVRAWDAPETHVELKGFMTRQLEESIRFDCGATDDEDEAYYPVPVLKSPEHWKAEALARAHEDLARHIKENAEEVARTEGRNKWIADLRASLEDC